MATSELRKPRNLGSANMKLPGSQHFVSHEEWSPMKSHNDDEWSYIPVLPEHNRSVIMSKIYAFSAEIFLPSPSIITTNEGKFFIDHRISNIYETIVESQQLSTFEDNWDDEDAVGFNKIIYDRAITLLIKYSDHLLKTYDTVISSPEINLGRDGSIDLEWRVNKNILLINILNTYELNVQYYGHDISTDTIVKGNLTNFNINQVLTFWMKCLV